MKNASYLNYLKNEYWIQLIVFCLVILLLILIVILLPSYLDCWYTNFLGPIANIGTVIIAMFIWFFQVKNYWKESLEKRITTHFIYQGKPVMSCYETYLSGTGDIRAWTQQIGRQMNNGEDLKFDPFILSRPPEICISSIEIDERGRGKRFMLYEVTLFLSSYKNSDFIDKYLFWIYDNPNRKILKGFFDIQPIEPVTIQKALSELKKAEENQNKK
ncbi:MAG: hypothetical protein Q8O72_07860 [Bacteroidales bacterium]|nr:hypothetical protein [Bacteroidales bacterium]